MIQVFFTMFRILPTHKDGMGLKRIKKDFSLGIKGKLLLKNVKIFYLLILFHCFGTILS